MQDSNVTVTNIRKGHVTSIHIFPHRRRRQPTLAMNRQPASFFPTTALVGHILSLYKENHLKKRSSTGPCSRWAGCWHRHYTMYEST